MIFFGFRTSVAVGETLSHGIANTNTNTNTVHANSFLGFRISVAVRESLSHGIALPLCV